ARGNQTGGSAGRSGVAARHIFVPGPPLSTLPSSRRPLRRVRRSLIRLRDSAVCGIVWNVTTSDITIVRIDPLDGDLVDSWIDAWSAAYRHAFPAELVPTPAFPRLRLLPPPAS